MTDTTTGKLAEALAKVQAALPTVHKGKTADTGKYSYDYADLADVTAAVMPLLAKNGLAFACHPRLNDAHNSYELAATLMHTSGESITGAVPIGGTAQQLGSAITYARRYLLGCLTGIVTDSDDDARIATEAAKANRREVHQQAAEEAAPKISQPQLAKMHALLGDLNLTDREKKLKLIAWHAGREIASSSDMTAREAKSFIDYLEGRLRDQQKENAS